MEHHLGDPATVTRQELLDHLLGFVTENKKALFRDRILHRTRHITIVLEDIFQPHNASAVLRTCDCFGIQDVHIIENENRYEVNPDVALGSSKWLSLYKYNREKNNTRDCLLTLKEKGYSIVAASPRENGLTPQDFPLEKKAALIFGTELKGLTKEALSLADAFIRIPMYGFTESFNISVSAAILLFALTDRLRRSDVNWHLQEAEMTEILIRWAKSAVRRSSLIEREFLKKSGGSLS